MPTADELLVDQTVTNKHVHQAVVQRHVRARPDLGEVGGKAAHLVPLHIDHDQAGSSFGRLLDERGGNRMISRCIRAGQQADVRLILPYVVRNGAAHATVRADTFDEAGWLRRRRRERDRLMGQRVGGTGVGTLPARHASALAHGPIQVERDLRHFALAAAPDHFVGLDIVAGPDAPITEDTRAVIDGNDRGREVLCRPQRTARPIRHLADPFERPQQLVPAFPFLQQPVFLGELLQPAGVKRRLALLRLRVAAQQQPQQHGPMLLDFRRRGMDGHSVGTLAYARRR